jgi:hypothetical protein
MSIIAINDELKTIPFLYIENDPMLRAIDKDCLESALGGMGRFADLKDYDIEYHFNAYSSSETFNKIVKAKYILLNTSFTGSSGDLLYNFVLGALHHGLKDKTIINCTCFSAISGLFMDLKRKIVELDEKQNIKFYFPSSNLNAFVKFNNDEGFTLL